MLTSAICFFIQNGDRNKDEIKAIRVLPFSGLQSDWDEWSEKYQGIAAERGYLQVMLGNELVPSDSLDNDQKVSDKFAISDEDERKQKHLMSKLNQKGYRDLQLDQVGFPTCIFGKNSATSQWIINQRLDCTQR